jgi:tetratricopeptide (TPR) repeat protein
LTGGSRTALPRQQTLSALIDWSYDLLSESEGSLFRRFAVFAGGCTYDAIEKVCTQLDVLNLLTQLVNKSLVAVDDEAGEPRYRLLETVRQYARDKLVDLGEAEQARSAHFEFFVNLVETAAPKLGTAEALGSVRQLAAEHDNIRAALDWGLANRLPDVLRTIPKLVMYWNRHGHEEAGRQLIAEAISRAETVAVPEGTPAREWQSTLGAAWQSDAELAYSQGDNDRGTVSAQKAVDFARELGDKHALSLALGFLAASLLFVEKEAEAVPYLEEAVAAGREAGDLTIIGLPLAMLGRTMARRQPDSPVAREYMAEGASLMRKSGNRWLATMSLLSTAMAASLVGDYADARVQFKALVPLFHELGDRHRINMVRSELAHIDRREGLHDQAEAAYRETILEWKRLGHRAAIAHQLESMAFIAQAHGDSDRAARLFGASAALRDRILITMTPSEKVEYDRQIESLRSSMPEQAFAAASAEGRLMNMEQAVNYALTPRQPDPGGSRGRVLPGDA